MSADALLQLVHWCDGQLTASNAIVGKHEQGGFSWAQKSPPARIDSETATGDDRAAGATLDAASRRATAGSSRSVDADRGAANGSSREQGGDR